MNKTHRDGSIADLLGKTICGTTFTSDNGLTLCFSDGTKVLLADATRRNRIFVMLPERANAPERMTT